MALRLAAGMFRAGPAASAAATSALVRPAVATAPLAWRSNVFGTRGFADLPDYEIVGMPALSPTMTEGTIASWNVEVGDEVEAGQAIAEIETDKATVALETQFDGVLAKVLVEAGAENVPVGQPIAVMVEDKADVAAFANFTAADAGGAADSDAAPEPAAAEPAAAAPLSPAPSAGAAAPAAGGDGRVVASPAARALARDTGLAINQVAGTGPGGRIIKADVASASATGAVAPATAAAIPQTATAGYVDHPHSKIRRVIASRLLASKQQIPHYYLTTEVQMDKLLATRAELNAVADGRYKLSVNDMIIKASALACRDVPEANSSWMDDAIRQYESVDVCVAVQTDSGLMTPIVESADVRGLADISAKVKDLATRARSGEILPHEISGGTFSVSNLGMFGVKSFSAIINPPQAAILAVGSTEDKVVPRSDGTGFETVKAMQVTLSCDHRVLDGAVGAQWLAAFKAYVEQPTTMLL